MSFGVADLDRAIAFHDAALTPIGLTRVWTNANAAGYGPGPRQPARAEAAIRPGHAAWPRLSPGVNAPTHDAVDAFHAAALRLGDTDNGAPGLRPHCGPTYDAACVIDPEGYRLEAVCR